MLFLFFFFLHVYVYECLRGEHICIGDITSQKRLRFPRAKGACSCELSEPMWVWGTKLKSTGRRAGAGKS